MKDKTVGESTEIITEMKVMAEVEIGIGLEKSHFLGILVVIEAMSGSRPSMNRDRIRCYKCREYDYFAKDIPTSRVERELEQPQQMLNLDDEQTALKP